MPLISVNDFGMTSGEYRLMEGEEDYDLDFMTSTAATLVQTLEKLTSLPGKSNSANIHFTYEFQGSYSAYSTNGSPSSL